MAYKNVVVDSNMSSAQLMAAIIDIEYNIDLAIQNGDTKKEQSYKSLLAKAKQYLIQAEQRESQGAQGGSGGGAGGGTGSRSSPPVYVPNKVDVPDVSKGATYEEVAAAVRNNLENDIARLKLKSMSYGGVLSGNDLKLSQDLGRRLANFDSWFKSVWDTEYKPFIKSKQTPIPIPVTSQQMAPQAVQNLSLQQFAKAAGTIKSPQQAEASASNFNEPMSTKPPISSQSTGMSGNPVDENGIPMVQTSAGWVKDRRFYKQDGSLFGMM